MQMKDLSRGLNIDRTRPIPRPVRGSVWLSSAARISWLTCRRPTFPNRFPSWPIRSQAFPNAPNRSQAFPIDSNMLPILCLIRLALKTSHFSGIITFKKVLEAFSQSDA
jgi:hypothetical protein